MADRKVLEFIQRAEQDPALRDRVRAVQVADKKQAFAELARIAESVGFGVSAEALETGLRECAPGELADGDLEAVSGGVGVPCNALGSYSYTSSSLQTSAFSSFFTQLNFVVTPCG